MRKLADFWGLLKQNLRSQLSQLPWKSQLSQWNSLIFGSKWWKQKKRERKLCLWRYTWLCTVHKLLFIMRLFFLTAAADGDDGFILHELLLSVSCQSVCHLESDTSSLSTKNIKLSPKSWKKQSEPLTPPLLYIKHWLSACASHSFISLPSLPHSVHVSHCIHVRLMWYSGLVPTSSQWNSWFQLGPLLGPLVHVHIHRLKKRGMACFLWLSALLKE